MKKIILFIITILLLPLNACAVDEVDYNISKYKIEADIKSNGDMEVCEYIKQSGSFNGFVRDLFYKSGDANYSPTNLTNIIVYDLNTESMTKGQPFSYDEYAKKGDVLKYKIENENYEPTVTMYNASEYGTKGYVLCYTLENSVLVHNDVAELYYNFIPNGFSDVLDDVSVTVNLPDKDNTLRVWAHGELFGKVSKNTNQNNSYLFAEISYINPGNVLNVRMTFDKNLVKNSTRFTNANALDDILEEEEKLAKKANFERQKEKYIVLFGFIEFGTFIIFLIYALVYTYLKHDKEYKVEFNMEYYRDFPSDIGPEILEYLIKKNNTTNSYSASILNLIYKKALILEQSDKKDYCLRKSDNVNIPITELESSILKFLIYNIGDGTKVTLKEIKKYGRKESTAEDFIDHFTNWKNDIINETEKYNFYEYKKNNTLGILTVLFIVINFIVGTITEIHVTSYLGLMLGIGVASYIFKASKRSKNGMLEYKKWMAFKRFLKDFGRFDEKELPEIVLWEKYLVYATVLGVADKLSKSMKIKIQEFNNNDFTVGDTILINNLLRDDFSSTINKSINNAYNTSRSTIASSSSSSGSGGGGGFSGGGSFSGGGGGGGGHGF